MAWQQSLRAALRALRKEEQIILKDLSSVRERIKELQSLSKAPAGKARAARGRQKRRLSPAGRAAISRAAKARWAAYRTRKGK